MPGSKKRSSKRRSKRGSKSLSKRITRIVSRKIETKVSTVVVGTLSVPQPVPYTGYWLLLNGLTQGTDQANRISNEIYLMSIEMRLQLIYGDNYNSFRLMIVMDKQANDAQFTMGDFMQTVNNPYSFINEDNKARFKILYDRCYSLNGFNDLNKQIHRRVPVRKHIFYNGTGSTIGNIKTNSIYLFCISDSLATLPDPGVVGTFRIYYKDA